MKEDQDKVVKGLTKRGIAKPESLIQEVLDLDQKRRTTQVKLDDTLSQSNNLARQIGQLMREGKKEEADRVKTQTSELKQLGKSLQENLSTFEEELKQLLYNIPNVPHESVPEGNSDQDNEVIYEHGKIPSLHDTAKPHWELIKEYDIIDFDLGNKVTGAGFPFYKGKGARLQRALINFFLDEALAAGYYEVQPPIVINEASGIGTGQLPDKEGQMYHATKDNVYLIPTAEVPITNMYRDSIIKSENLPIKNVGYTPCFRREAGSWGADVRGLNRLHQFDKVEIIQIQKPEKSYEAFDEMCKHVQGLLEKLNLPYRVLRLCGGDIGYTAALTFDMEVYSAAQKRWLEVSSVSNVETYQSNRLKLRYKDESKKTKLLHTLNGSALALPRIVAAILENNQTENGIVIPEVLRKYTGFDKI
ncbi:serine--tRNA ligase [Xanthovirga aplysinae]|uniref:serine--tRNA ligase n=1 Tax=Xanthovirga aplysinae TaxID=2529853 RepID=UPI003CCD9142